MTNFIPLIIIGSIIAAFTFYKYIYKKRKIKISAAEIFKKIIEKNPKFQLVTSKLISYPELSGKINGIFFKCKVICESGNFYDDYYFDFVTRHRSFNDAQFIITEEFGFQAWASTFGHKDKDIQTGDVEFDKAMCIKSSSHKFIIAMLDYELRKLLSFIQPYSRNMKLDKRELRILYDFFSTNDPVVILNIIKNMTKISKKIEDKKSLREKLLDNIQNEKNNGALLRFVEMINENPNLNENEIAVFNKLIEKSDVNIQVEAAKNLGPKGMKHLSGMLKNNEAKDDDLIIKIIHILKKEKYKRSKPQLKNIFVKTQNDKIKIEILNTFEEFKDQTLSPFLVEQIKSTESEVLQHLIKALETCGTKDAVEPLYNIAKNSLNPFLKNKVEQAIAGIQSRLGDVDDGWLSVTDISENEGGLSLADEAGEGALSDSE